MAKRKMDQCTEFNARWCPVCGECFCLAWFKPEPECPLHGTGNKHAEMEKTLRALENDGLREPIPWED